MSKQVTFEQKKALIKLGYDFDSLCFCGGSMDCICEHLPDENKLIPVYEALDFIREEKGIACATLLDVTMNGDFIGYKGVYIDDRNTIYTDLHHTHHLAESALLDAVLTYLEKK